MRLSSALKMSLFGTLCLILSSCNWRVMEEETLRTQLASPEGVVSEPRANRMLELYKQQQDILGRMFPVDQLLRANKISAEQAQQIKREGLLRSMPVLLGALATSGREDIRRCLHITSPSSETPETGAELHLSCFQTGGGKITFQSEGFTMTTLLGFLVGAPSPQPQGSLDLDFSGVCLHDICFNGRMVIELNTTDNRRSYLVRYQLNFYKVPGETLGLYGGLLYQAPPTPRADGTQRFDLAQLMYVGEISGDPDCPKETNIQGVVLQMTGEPDEAYHGLQLKGSNGLFDCKYDPSHAHNGACEPVTSTP